jgi:hypothetical protein
MSTSEGQEGDPQDNFVENKDPTELALCFILASAYLGLAKYCWMPLLLAKNWKLLINVEGFFIIISVLSILVGLRPYLSPSSLQLSMRGIKYRGPYWPQRKTVNWEQVTRVYLSSELIVVLYKPRLNSNRIWPLLIPSIYLADRERIGQAVMKYCPIEPIIMTSPALVSRIALSLMFLAVVVWLLEMLTG